MRNVVIFDGVCNLCNRAVDILIRLDRKAILSFAPMQGETAKEIGIHQERLAESEQSILYLKKQDDIVFYRSDAVIEIITDLFWWGKIVKVFKILPRFMRDGLYRWVAKNRYTFFGKRDTCRLPTKEEAARFLP